MCLLSSLTTKVTMSILSSTSPQLPVISRRSLSYSSLDTSDHCLDLSLKEFWLIVHYPDSDPGNEYEILSEKDLEVDSWDVLERGAHVVVKYGNAKVQGKVVTVSDDYSYLKTNFKTITEEHSESLEDIKLHPVKRKRPYDFPENGKPFIERHIIKVMDKETQTDCIDCDSTNKDYEELKRKYEELQKDYNKFTALFADVKFGLEETIVKLQNVNLRKESNSKKISVTDSRHNRTMMEREIEENKENIESGDMIQIGSRGTRIPKSIYYSIKWSNYSTATRKLLITLFPRNILATQSLTGKPSPAFLTSDKQTKMRLNPTIVSDIVEIVSKKCMVSESLVRNAITTKCADENKLYRKRMEKSLSNDLENETDDAKKLKSQIN